MCIPSERRMCSLGIWWTPLALTFRATSSWSPLSVRRDWVHLPQNYCPLDICPCTLVSHLALFSFSLWHALSAAIRVSFSEHRLWLMLCEDREHWAHARYSVHVCNPGSCLPLGAHFLPSSLSFHIALLPVITKGRIAVTSVAHASFSLECPSPPPCQHPNPAKQICPSLGQPCPLHIAPLQKLCFK